MVNLQNQLEAALSTALVSAIDAQDSAACKDYFSIFSIIQRESEFRNYYYGSRRSPILTLWRTTPLVDCDPAPSLSKDGATQTFEDFLPTFFASFHTLLTAERVSITSIFPNPVITLSQFISSTLTSLQPTIPQRLNSCSLHHSDALLPHLISLLRATESFAVNVEKLMEKVKYASSSSSSMPPTQGSSSTEKPQGHRRRSSRMSISIRANRSLPPISGAAAALAEATESMEWDQELFQPFLDFQADYGSLERRYLEHSLLQIISNDSRDNMLPADRPRLFRERALDVFSIAEGSMDRCKMFTYGYGSASLLQSLDGFFGSFINMWTADVQIKTTSSALPAKSSMSDGDLSDLDYTPQDWSDIQLSLHLLSSARTVFDRVTAFEVKLRAHLSQTASHFRLASNDPSNFLIAATRGESQLLEQSTLNSAELHALLSSIENDANPRDPPFSASLRLQQPAPLPTPLPLLVNARKALSDFAKTCQKSTTETILSPLRNHLAGYSSLPAWRTSTSNTTTSDNDLRVPSFSLSHSETMQRVAEGLLNLPRLFEVYADDDALAFSLETLPYVEPEMLQNLSDQTMDATGQQRDRRRSSVYVKATKIDPEVVSSAWLLSLGRVFLESLTTEILPVIPSLTSGGAAQLASDLEYISNIVRALNVEHPALEKWKTYVTMDSDEGIRTLGESEDTLDPILSHVAKIRGWR